MKLIITMGLKLYGTDISPPVRSVLLVSKAIGLDITFQNVDLMKGEHLTPEYMKLNPQHTVPTLVDGNFTIWDSHAINLYLIEKYAKNDALYPKDLQKRAVIDQRMFFDAGVLFAKVKDIAGPIFRQGAKTVPQEKADAAIEAYKFLETFLGDNPYVAGNQLTVADLQIVTTITELDTLVPLPKGSFPKIVRWWNLMKTLPYYDICQAGADKLAAIFKQLLG